MMDSMDMFLTLAGQVVVSPVLYAGAVGVVVGMYAVWQLSRASYLAAEKQFTTLWLALGAGWLASMVVGWVVIGLNQGGWLAGGQWWWNVWPFGGAALAKSWQWLALWLAMAGAAWWYIKQVRYPVWHMLDMASIGVGWVAVGVIVGWIIEWPRWESVVAGVGLAAVQIGWWWLLLRRKPRSGLVAAGQVVVMMGAFGGMKAATAWQGVGGIVEWVPVGLGLMAGLAVLGYRLWPHTTKKLTTQELPVRLKIGAARPMMTTPVSMPARPTPAVLMGAPSRPLVSSSSKGVSVAVSNVGEIIAPPVEKQVKGLTKKRGGKSKKKEL